ncbi:MAG: tripartite tricarboxylate transporter substrate binding protein [Variibacter sp.]|nr:tripartite tricarboxylate transporter substrate binding protein [Variibacter sp.]
MAERATKPTKASRRAFLAAAAGAGGSLLLARGAAAQAYPSRIIRVIVPFPAGATTDMLARLIGQRMSESMGQNVIVENVGGGGGSIGADQVAKSPADGHTLLFHNITFITTTTSLQAAGRSRHDIEQDFVPISVGAWVPLLYLAHPSVPATDLKSFIAYAKEAKEPLFYGSTGPGSAMHLMVEALKRETGIKVDHIPYRGAAPLVQELLSGRIQLGGDQLSSSLQHVRAGALKALAVASPKRSFALPDVATVREQGFPVIEYQGFNGYLAPKGTPEPIVARLAAEIAAAVKHPDVQKRMLEVGAEPAGGGPEEMRAMLREQITRMRPIVDVVKPILQ